MIGWIWQREQDVLSDVLSEKVYQRLTLTVLFGDSIHSPQKKCIGSHPRLEYDIRRACGGMQLPSNPQVGLRHPPRVWGDADYDIRRACGVECRQLENTIFSSKLSSLACAHVY